jgi:hypothetical protein
MDDVLMSYVCLVVTRLLTPKLRARTSGQVKQLVFDALVELEQGDHGFIVKFSARFRREVGLPGYAT